MVWANFEIFENQGGEELIEFNRQYFGEVPQIFPLKSQFFKYFYLSFIEFLKGGKNFHINFLYKKNFIFQLLN
jgi:hypothetical protein